MLSPLLPKRCAFCRKPHPGRLCGDCQDTLPWRSPPDGYGVIAPLYYQDEVRSALHRFKFRGVTGYAGVFGALMAQAVIHRGVKADIVTWVPCSLSRRWSRGYDQSEKLARAVGKKLGLPVEKLLFKIHNTRPQTKMPDDDARRRNVHNAFITRPFPPGKRVLLIDDIHTSGATLEVCTKTLLAAGAASVTCCAAAARR